MNRYHRASKLDEQRFLNLVEAFCSDLPASIAARASRVSVRTANAIYVSLRYRLMDDVHNYETAYGSLIRRLNILAGYPISDIYDITVAKPSPKTDDLSLPGFSGVYDLLGGFPNYYSHRDSNNILGLFDRPYDLFLIPGVLQIISRVLLARISARAIRPEEYQVHGFELLARAFNSIGDDLEVIPHETSRQVTTAVRALNLGDTKAFKHIISSIEPLVLEETRRSSTPGDSLFKEIRESLSIYPLGSRSRSTTV